MIFQIFMVICMLGVTLICNVIGESYSNVYMERDVVPMRYYQYGTPYTSVADPRLSQINTLPAIQGYVGPCVSPCVYPVQTAATVASVNPSTNVLPYNAPAPSVPIVVAPTKEEATPYEYSYFIYDENTGDNKAQRELSDGSVVRGEYSFLQPDGYVREVQYVADDISGFNAVVKNFLPVAAEGKRKDKDQEKESSPPCNEIKNESLKEESEGVISMKQSELTEKSKKSGGEEILQTEFKESGEDVEVKSKDKPQMKPKYLKEESEEQSEESSKVEKLHKKPKQTTDESKKESVSEESKEELKEKTRKKSEEDYWEKNKKGSKEASDGNAREESVEANYGKHKETDELLKPTDEVLVSYKDIIKCIEAAMKRNYGVPAAMRQGPSPLTYIVLNKPC